MNFKKGDWVIVDMNCVHSSLKSTSSYLPELPIYVGQIEQIRKAQRPYGMKFVGQDKIKIYHYQYDDWFYHDYLFWFREVELKKLSKNQKQKAEALLTAFRL